VSGKLPPGDRIYDKELAERLGVSRTPVREALQRLEDEGLVETLPGSMTRVTPLDARQVRDAFPVVAALHALGVRLAAGRLTPEEIAALREANARLRAAMEAEETPAATAADDDFHGVFVVAADNRELRHALDRLMPKVRRLEYIQFSSLAGRRSVEQHEAIIAACMAGNYDRAAVLVEENWLSLGQLLVRSLEQTREGDATHARR